MAAFLFYFLTRASFGCYFFLVKTAKPEIKERLLSSEKARITFDVAAYTVVILLAILLSLNSVLVKGNSSPFDRREYQHAQIKLKSFPAQ